MENIEEISEQTSSQQGKDETTHREWDTSVFNHVDTIARIAVYDDLLSSPRIIDIQPNTTREYIDDIASTVYTAAKESGGAIPYSIILQVAENFIHSYFSEVVVTIINNGNTIRFADQGPGIADKQKVKNPGFSSATAEMKRTINGVGSGLPIVSEYMETMHGSIKIEDNIDSGAVITISLDPNAAPAPVGQTQPPQAQPQYQQPQQQVQQGYYQQEAQQQLQPQYQPSFNEVQMQPSTMVDQMASAQPPMQAMQTMQQVPQQATTQQPVQQAVASTQQSTKRVVAPQTQEPISTGRLIRAMISERGMDILRLFEFEDVWRVTDISAELDFAPSTVHNELKKLEEAGMIAKLGKKRVVTELGARFLNGEL